MEHEMLRFEKYCEMIFWDFVRMDNAVYNFAILSTLIKSACKRSNEAHFYKPIIILMMAILECTIYDFLCRIQEERHEGINLLKNEQKIIRDKNISKQFCKYVDICKKHKLLGDEKPDIYEGLYKYIKYRNRIHIQNLHQDSPPKECTLWNYHKMKSCGRLFSDVFKYLCENYPRPKQFHSNPDIDKFPTPWDKLDE